MKVYIAGKITGDSKYKEKFAAAEKEIQSLSFPFLPQILNPAVLPEGMSRADYMRICFAMIDCANYVYFLPDSKESDGAIIERAYCEYIGKPFLDGHAAK